MHLQGWTIRSNRFITGWTETRHTCLSTCGERWLFLFVRIFYDGPFRCKSSSFRLDTIRAIRSPKAIRVWMSPLAKVSHLMRRTSHRVALFSSLERYWDLLHPRDQLSSDLVSVSGWRGDPRLFHGRSTNTCQSRLFRSNRSVGDQQWIRIKALQYDSVQSMCLLEWLLVTLRENLFSYFIEIEQTRVTFNVRDVFFSFSTSVSLRPVSVHLEISRYFHGRTNVRLPKPKGKQRSFSAVGNSGRKVTSFGAQSADGSMSCTNE